VIEFFSHDGDDFSTTNLYAFTRLATTVSEIYSYDLKLGRLL